MAECQIGYFYYDGLGVEKNLEKPLECARRELLKKAVFRMLTFILYVTIGDLTVCLRN